MVTKDAPLKTPYLDSGLVVIVDKEPGAPGGNAALDILPFQVQTERRSSDRRVSRDTATPERRSSDRRHYRSPRLFIEEQGFRLEAACPRCEKPVTAQLELADLRIPQPKLLEYLCACYVLQMSNHKISRLTKTLAGEL